MALEAAIETTQAPSAHDDRLGLALSLAIGAHLDQKDKIGEPYMGHVLRVAARVADSPLAIAVALLHDVVEDSPLSIDSVRGYFGDVIADAVDALTHRKGESRNDYLYRVARNPVAIRVKLADVADNADESRLAFVYPPSEQDRLRRKYRDNWKMLTSVAVKFGTLKGVHQ